MQFIYRIVVFIAASIIIGDKMQGVTKKLAISIFKRAEKRLDLEFDLWWISGPQQLVHDNIQRQLHGNNPEMARKIELKVRRNALIMALYVHNVRSRLKRSNLISEGLLEGAEAGMIKVRTYLLLHGVNPVQIEQHFARTG